MPAPLLPREEVVMRLLAVFQAHGYDGASLAELSTATGLGKSSLYHYFPGGKADMARAVIARVNRWLVETAIRPLRGPGTPARRLARMLDALDAFYAGGRKCCVLGNLVMGGARRLVQAELRAAFELWIRALADLAVEAGVPRARARERAEDAVVAIEGALIVAGGRDNPAPFRRALRRIPGLLLARG
jgi:TetR/AcrR family transcriptional repressor of lmrAB and yxaGH operons